MQTKHLGENRLALTVTATEAESLMAALGGYLEMLQDEMSQPPPPVEDATMPDDVRAWANVTLAQVKGKLWTQEMARVEAMLEAVETVLRTHDHAPLPC